MIKHVSRFFRPREDETPSAIEVEGYGTIDEETVSELPPNIELEKLDDTRNLDLMGVRIDIRRTDRDLHKQWAAKILDDKRFRRRLPMDIYPTVDVASLAEERVVVADLILQGDTDEKGEFRPKRMHLLKFQRMARTTKPTRLESRGEPTPDLRPEKFPMFDIRTFLHQKLPITRCLGYNRIVCICPSSFFAQSRDVSPASSMEIDTMTLTALIAEFRTEETPRRYRDPRQRHRRPRRRNIWTGARSPRQPASRQKQCRSYRSAASSTPEGNLDPQEEALARSVLLIGLRD